MLVFTIFFGRLARIPSDGAPYPLFYFAALVPWGYFSGAMVSASVSLVNHTHMITKLYFPRIILPLAAIIGKFVDFLIALERPRKNDRARTIAKGAGRPARSIAWNVAACRRHTNSRPLYPRRVPFARPRYSTVSGRASSQPPHLRNTFAIRSGWTPSCAIATPPLTDSA